MGRKYSVGYDKLAVEHQHKQQVLLLQCHIFFHQENYSYLYILKNRSALRNALFVRHVAGSG